MSGHNNSPLETLEQLLKEEAPEDMRVLLLGHTMKWSNYNVMVLFWGFKRNNRVLK